MTAPVVRDVVFLVYRHTRGRKPYESVADLVGAFTSRKRAVIFVKDHMPVESGWWEVVSVPVDRDGDVETVGLYDETGAEIGRRP